MNTALNKAILRCKTILSLPSIYQKVSIKIEQPQTTNHELAEIIKLDVGISSRLLAIVNSAFYGFPSQISSVSHAISIVGLNDFKNLVLSASIVNQFEEVKSSGFSMDEFWNDSLFCAILAKHIAKHWASRKEQESLFIAGLLHDVGKLVMVKNTTGDLKALEELWRRGDLNAEKAAYEYNHIEAGEALINSWGLPPELAQCARYHHCLPDQADINVSILCVHMAHLLASIEDLEASPEIENCNALAPETLPLDTLLEIKQKALDEKSTLIGLYLSH